ncbi:MAG: hypothetical protein NTU61_02495 [Candidatus Altiarchaeota archaeon]|nr:hypothetical protein [Candidatus Altiarchaeota archaeon]
MEKERIKSGIPGLDDLLNGGLPKNGIYVVVGETGTGKSIFGAQFIYNGAVDYNEPGVYVILEEDKKYFIENMQSLGWDFDKLEKEGKVKVVPYIKSIIGDVSTSLEIGLVSNDSSMDRARQYLTVNSMFMQIQEECARIKAKRVVIDPISIITLLTDSEVLARMQLISLFEGLRRLEVTSIIMVEEGVRYWEDVTFLCDGIIRLIMKEKNSLFERGLLVRKMRGTGHDTGMRPLKIMKDGLRIYPNEVMFR